MAKEAGIKANLPRRELIEQLNARNGKENQGPSAAQGSPKKLSPVQISAKACRTPAIAISATPASSVYSIGVEGLLQTGLAEAEEDIVDEDGRNDDDGEELEDVGTLWPRSRSWRCPPHRASRGLPVWGGAHTRF